MWYETLQEAMNAEKSAYIERHIYSENGEFFGFAPKQFNVQIGETVDGEKRYRCEFLEKEGTWRDATTWHSGNEALKVFIECDAEKMDLTGFEPDWITKI